MSMKHRISKIVEQIPPSGIRQFFELVIGMKDVISLGVGEPDFITPWNIREAAIFSLEQGYTSYTSNKGLAELRREIARFLKQRHDLDYDPEEEILITVGVSEAKDLTLRAILNRGEKILIPEPCYVSYAPLTTLAGGRAVYMPTDKKGDFKLSPKAIDKSCDKKTKAIILNYPSNPTGISYTRRELKEFAKVIEKHDLLVISDEIYDELTYDFPHTPFPTLRGMKKRTVYLNGFSKAYAMTGWRVGYACGPREIIAAMTKIHQYTIMCVPIMGQMAAIEALKNGDKSVEEMKKEYKRRRDFIVDGLNNIGLKCHKPRGAFYVFPSIEAAGLTSIDFATSLLKKEKVAVVPGTAFGPSGEGHVRMAYAASFENIKEALGRISRFISTI
ncbi:MAG: aminotransferase class I/II-fold pyridoxal phosphate-dependent enzyme [Candidatus Omnitrophica bacterium]|nr:aminotransferase class I/II-fold pyridoxal phosphate-dependent enzyme [Candidatus Omnitrophota bacterium]